MGDITAEDVGTSVEDMLIVARVTELTGTFAIDTIRVSKLGAAPTANLAALRRRPLTFLAGVPPIGLQPYRRTIAQLRIDPPAPADLPLVIDALGRFYFKPEAGRLWLSPHDETACDPWYCAPV